MANSANEITNILSNLAEILFKNINFKSDKPYIGIEGETHEVR